MTAVVCVKCELDMKPVKSGAVIEEMAQCEPYKIWSGDVFKCECCGAEVATRFGLHPVAEHWMQKYAGWVADLHCRAFEKLEYRLERDEKRKTEGED